MEGPKKGPLNWLRAAVGLAAATSAMPAEAQEAQLQPASLTVSGAERPEPHASTPPREVAAFHAEAGAFRDDHPGADIVDIFSTPPTFASAGTQSEIARTEPATRDTALERIAERFSSDNPLAIPVVDRTDVGLRTRIEAGVVKAAGEDGAGLNISITN